MNKLLKLKRRTQYLFVKKGYFNELGKTWLVRHCYIDMYAVSTPKGDFNEMVEYAALNERGEKDIPFSDYTITKKNFYDILSFYQSFFSERYYKEALSRTIHLGCSPVIKDA